MRKTEKRVLKYLRFKLSNHAKRADSSMLKIKSMR